MRLFLLVVVAVLLLAQGCGSSDGQHRVIVLGLDGVDPDAVDLLMSEGQLPNFARLRQEGAYGRLKSFKPLLSPVVWTTIATGRTPEHHRIGHFVAVNPTTGENLPVTSQMRGVKAIWNLASDAGKTVASVGWWATWPAETVRGSIISDHLCYHFLFEDGFDGGSPEALGKTSPPELMGEVEPLVRRPGDLGPEDLEPFVRVPPGDLDRPFDFHDDLSHFKWALATAESHRDIGLHLWREERPDLLLTYIEGVDSTSHLFGHLFRTDELAGELAAQKERYGDAVEAMYRFADRALGEYLDAVDDNTTLVVLSDHGFELGALPEDPSKTRSMRRVSEKYHEEEGVLYLFGSRVRRYTRIDRPTILDVTPTVLALLGIPPAKDMPGRVLVEALELQDPDRVDTHETGEAVGEDQIADSTIDPEIMEKLRSLGYLDTASPDGERNLAALLFEEGRFEEAVEAYREQIRQDPDDGSLRASLAGALGAMGQYDEALEELNRAIELQPLNPEAYHNRAVIHERQGNTEAALHDYRAALKFNPQYEPSRQGLGRLQGDLVFEPGTAEEKRAYELAQEAGLDSRRGDYRAALAKLDEAQRLAPELALIYQYRSNVAYLSGDREAAIAALEEGLRIDPGNVLFHENLRRLKE